MRTPEKSKTIHNPPFPKNYASSMLIFEKGQGCYLEDAAGNRYLDFGAGISVNALGYGRDDLAEIASEQMRKLIHVSNLYTTGPTVEAAEKLRVLGNFDAVQFGNSGAEANEAALKYARMYAKRTRGEGHHKFMSFENGFHGRTMGALSCTSNPKYRTDSAPLIPGVEILPFNDTAALEATLNGQFAAVIVEAVQGEGGLTVMSRDFAAALNRLCRKHDVILIADEVQTGLGRTGFPFASGAVGLEPDIITLAKPLAAGLPLSATLIPEKINKILLLGDHGTTFAGGPVTTAVASRVLDILLDPEFLLSLQESCAVLDAGLQELQKDHESVTGLRGLGMLRGLVIQSPRFTPAEIIAKGADAGLILLRSGSDVLRIAPPLIITPQEIKKGLEILHAVLSDLEQNT